LRGHQSYWIGEGANGLILTNYICNKPNSKQGHILTSWGLGLQHTTLGLRRGGNTIPRKPSNTILLLCLYGSAPALGHQLICPQKIFFRLAPLPKGLLYATFSKRPTCLQLHFPTCSILNIVPSHCTYHFLTS
jgi:hypothetical protein